MDDKTFYTLITTILLAIIGIGAKYWNDLRIVQRKDRLERVNDQLKMLYGPLFALEQAGDMAWKAFRTLYRPGKHFFINPPPSEEEAAAWRLWMREVFMPLNIQRETIIIENMHLLREGRMPDCFLNLCAHVAAYKPVLKNWEEGDFSQHLSIINYPVPTLRKYIESSFNALISEQISLLGKLR